MGAEHSSVPRWPAEISAVDSGARSLAIVAFGTSGERHLAAWREAVPTDLPVWTHVAEGADEEALASLAAEVARARVGWRLMLAGPEADVLAARSVAVAAGVLDAEIRMAVTGPDRKRIFCAHCRTTTEAVVPVAGEIPCSGCARRLHVYGHVSRRLGAYLGFMADAEEVA